MAKKSHYNLYIKYKKIKLKKKKYVALNIILGTFFCFVNIIIFTNQTCLTIFSKFFFFFDMFLIEKSSPGIYKVQIIISMSFIFYIFKKY